LQGPGRLSQRTPLPETPGRLLLERKEYGMRAKMRVALVVAGAFLIAFMGLLTITAVSGAPAWAWAAGAVGAIGVIISVVLGMIAIDRMTRASDRTSTRTSNLEKRAEQAREAGAEASEEISRLRDELQAVRADGARAQRLSALDEQVVTLERTARVLRRRVPEGFLEPLRAEISELSDVVSLQSGTAREAWVLSAESALQLGRRPRSFLTVAQAAKLFE